jgi:MFS family permease
VLPVTRDAWGLSARDAGMIQGAFYLGYLVSLFAAGLMADRFGAKFTYLSGGVAAWATPIIFVVFADGFWSAFLLLALTGLCQGSTYAPAMALVNENVARAYRGRAMGYLIAAACGGYALCLGVAGALMTRYGWRGALAAVALMPLTAWVIGIAALRDTPNVVHPRPHEERLLGSLRAVLANRRGMLSIWGYSFHTWEQFGVWAWLPAFLAAGLIAAGHDVATGAAVGAALSAITHVANIAGSITGGTMADRWGRTQTLLLWSIVSAAACFLIGWLVALPLALLVVFACVLNFAAVADSSTHSTVLAESVPAHQLGMAYAIRGVLAVGAGAVSPVVFGWVFDLAGGGRGGNEPLAWGLAFGTLALGALLGPLATWRLHALSR